MVIAAPKTAMPKAMDKTTNTTLTLMAVALLPKGAPCVEHIGRPTDSKCGVVPISIFGRSIKLNAGIVSPPSPFSLRSNGWTQLPGSQYNVSEAAGYHSRAFPVAP